MRGTIRAFLAETASGMYHDLGVLGVVDGVLLALVVVEIAVLAVVGGLAVMTDAERAWSVAGFMYVAIPWSAGVAGLGLVVAVLVAAW